MRLLRMVIYVKNQIEKSSQFSTELFGLLIVADKKIGK